MYVKSGSPVTLHCQISSYLQAPSYVEWILNGTQLIRVKMVGTSSSTAKSYNQQQQQQSTSSPYILSLVCVCVFHFKSYNGGFYSPCRKCNCNNVRVEIEILIVSKVIRLFCANLMVAARRAGLCFNPLLSYCCITAGCNLVSHQIVSSSERFNNNCSLRY